MWLYEHDGRHSDAVLSLQDRWQSDADFSSSSNARCTKPMTAHLRLWMQRTQLQLRLSLDNWSRSSGYVNIEWSFSSRISILLWQLGMATSTWSSGCTKSSPCGSLQIYVGRLVISTLAVPINPRPRQNFVCKRTISIQSNGSSANTTGR